MSRPPVRRSRNRQFTSRGLRPASPAPSRRGAAPSLRRASLHGAVMLMLRPFCETCTLVPPLCTEMEPPPLVIVTLEPPCETLMLRPFCEMCTSWLFWLLVALHDCVVWFTLLFDPFD